MFLYLLYRKFTLFSSSLVKIFEEGVFFYEKNNFIYINSNRIANTQKKFYQKHITSIKEKECKKLMNILEIIEKKRDKKELTEEDIKFFIKGYTSGEIADYQAAALIMAIYINGMTDKESTNLTMEMAFRLKLS